MQSFRLPSTSGWLVALAVIFICMIPAYAGSTGPAAAYAVPISIDISSLTSFLDTLPTDEKDEQLRDWAAYGLRNTLSPAKAGELPVRHPALEGGRHGEVSPGRVLRISREEWAIIAPLELLLDKPRLGGLVDRTYEESGRLPERVSFFSYRYDASSAQLNVEYAGTVDLKRVFSPEYGYRVQTVTGLAELTNFVDNIDDLTGFSWRSGRLTLTGRKYVTGNKRALTVEDVAGLYQAYSPPALDRVALEKQVQRSFSNLLQSDPGLRKALRQGRVKKAQVLARLRRRLSPKKTSGQVGFSLDPEYDYAALAQELRILSVGAGHGGADPLPALRAAVDSATRQLERRHDLRPLLALQRRYQNSDDAAERSVAAYLQGSQRRCAFQAARYDGNLQGTTVGMPLFYTDLLAKLWALDYHGIAPKGRVQGFRNMAEIAVPRLYWDDFQRLSKTRLWFGLRSEGFDVYGDTVLFQPAVTRVYAASSDPMYPGKESKPNFQSEAFLGWWDRHYESVAAVEPYYYKLDQIQKWSCALMILKEKKSHLLDFLRSYPVRHNLDFERWSKSEPVLARLDLKFVDRVRLGRSTECLPLLASRDYPMMGQHFVLSGGVSLASRKDILSKLHKHRKESYADDEAGGASPGARKTAKGSTAAQTGAKRILAAGTSEKVARIAENPTAPASKVVRKKSASAATAGDEGETPARRGSEGATAAVAPVKMRLTWKKTPSVAVHDLVNALAAKQQKEGRHGDAAFEGLAEVRKVVRLREGVYLVKTDAARESWIYVEVNPGRTDGFPAKASAAQPDADIFCAKVVPDSHAHRLAAGEAGL